MWKLVYYQLNKANLMLDDALVEFTEQDGVSLFYSYDLIGTNRKILVWTTTPWAILDNPGLALNGTAKYCLLQLHGQEYYVSIDALPYLFDKLNVKNLRFDLTPITAKDLCAYRAINPVTHEIIPVFMADYVLPMAGTGIVLQAPAYSDLDYTACVAAKINFTLETVFDKRGVYRGPITAYQNKSYKSLNDLIIANLKATNHLIDYRPRRHKIPTYNGRELWQLIRASTN